MWNGCWRDKWRAGADHVRASTALPPAFSAMAVDGRLFVDGALSANLPIDPVLAAPGEGPLLCIAVALLPAAALRPRRLGEVIARTQDLISASQSRRIIARWREVQAAGKSKGDPVVVARLAYADQQCEGAGRVMDFSPGSGRSRWHGGVLDARAMLERVANGPSLSEARGPTIAD